MTYTIRLVCAALVPLTLGVAAWAAEPAPPRMDPRAITPEGLGPVKAGMTVAEAAKALGVKLVEAPAAAGAAGCHTAEGVGLPGVVLVIENGKVSRIGIYGVTFQTTKGVRVGTRESEARGRYPGIQAAPHRYDSAGRYLTLASADGKSALKLETDGARVTSIHSGVLAAVARPDVCP